MNNKDNRELYKFYNELNEEELIFCEGGKYYIVIEGKSHQVSQAIFECYKKLCWKYDYNTPKHGNIISLDGHFDKMQDAESKRYTTDLEYSLLYKDKSVEEQLIQKSINEKIIEVASRHHYGLYIIKRMIQGYSDTEMAKEIGISRKTFTYPGQPHTRANCTCGLLNYYTFLFLKMYKNCEPARIMTLYTMKWF